MTAIHSKLNPRAPDFKASREAMAALVADLSVKIGSSARVAARQRGRSTSAAASCCRANASGAARRRLAVSGAVAACRVEHVRRAGAGRRHHYRRGADIGARVRHRCHDATVKGGTYFR